SYANFDGVITGAHIHQAEAGANGDVVINLTDYIDEESQTIRANITAEGGLNASVIEAIMSGENYINIHSEENPSGETRGQINNTASLKTQTSVEYIDLPEVNLYPNPTVNSVSLNLGDLISSSKVEIRVYDRAGRMSAKYVDNNTGLININVSDLTSGLYFIEVSGNETSVRAKFIKQ
ncbi:MAG: CHRD domain-containing protein, partial [Candidatus Kapaibacterium sp.]